MDLQLNGKRALVSAGHKGIGNASASSQHGEGPEPWRRSFDVDILGTAMF